MTQPSPAFEVRRDLCKHCSLCVKDCPTNVLQLDPSGCPEVVHERADACVSCQHCLAICPEGAISLKGFRPENSRAVSPEALPRFEQMELLVRARRSVRQYRKENVDPGLIQRLLDAVAHCPTGVNVRQLTFTLISERDTLSKLRVRVLDALAVAGKEGTLPARSQFLANAARLWREEGRDLIFRDAPHLLIVSAPTTTPTPLQDVPLTLATFDLLAQSAGLGTVWCGYLTMAFEAVPSLKALVNLAEGHVYGTILFGTPAVKYARTVQREGSAQLHRVASIAGV